MGEILGAFGVIVPIACLAAQIGTNSRTMRASINSGNVGCAKLRGRALVHLFEPKAGQRPDKPKTGSVTD